MTSNIKILSKQEFLKQNKQPDQEEVWDSISDLWVNYKKEPFFHVKEFLEKTSSDFNKSEKCNFAKDKLKIIDLGCGSGRNMIANKNFEYYGVDFSSCQLACAIENAKEKGINAKFLKIKADKLSKKIFKNEMFDYGLFIATLHCIESEKERLNALKEFHRILKKNAEALISVWNSDDSRFNIVNNHGDIYMSWRKDGKEHFRYYYLYNEDELIDLLKESGFEILEIYRNEDFRPNNKEEKNKSDRFSKKNIIVRVKRV